MIVSICVCTYIGIPEIERYDIVSIYLDYTSIYVLSKLYYGSLSQRSTS